MKMNIIDRNAEYKELVLANVLDKIAKKVGCDEDEAHNVFFNALAMNTVVAEIMGQVDLFMFINECEEQTGWNV